MTRVPRQLYRLFDGVCTGALDAAQQAELSAALLTDHAVRAQYFAYCQMHTDLHFTLAALAAQRSAEARLAPPAVPFHRRAAAYFSQPLQFSVMVATITMVSLLLTAAQFGWSPAPATARAARPAAARDAAPAPARLVQSSSARWASGAALRAGGALPAGRVLDLQAGEALVAFASGAELTLAAPVRLTIDGPLQATLARGAVVALAPPSARGFTLKTPQAALVDLGTEFAARVDDDQATEAHVFAGRIEVVPTAPHLPRQTLDQGAALHVTAQAARPLAAAPERFVRALAPPDETIRLSHLQWLVAPTGHFAARAAGPSQSSSAPFKLALMPGCADPTVQISQTRAVESLAGRRVTARVAVRHGGASADDGALAAGQRLDARLLFRRGDNSVIATTDAALLRPQDATDLYHPRQISAVAPAEAARVTLSLILRTDAEHYSTGAVWIDDAALVLSAKREEDSAAADRPESEPSSLLETSPARQP